MKSDLAELGAYVREKVSVASLPLESYISTENMLPNKGGLTLASALPTTTFTQGYKADDILISNIRPYFKKIWFAQGDGGCSNDVLVIRARDGVDPRFLYYVLADDAFFTYSNATSKGTKMPRGDKDSIMKFQVPIFDLQTQGKIAGILGCIDAKIQTNSEINDNLAA